MVKKENGDWILHSYNFSWSMKDLFLDYRILGGSGRIWDKPYDLADKEDQRHRSLCSKDYNLRSKSYH